MVNLRGLWTSPVVAGGLISGYAVAAVTGVRPLGGIVLLVAGGLAALTWRRRNGWPTAAGLSVIYAAAFAASHPLATAIGTWPSVLGVSALAALSAYVASDRRMRRRNSPRVSRERDSIAS